MPKTDGYVHVALPVPLDRLFEYSIDVNDIGDYCCGSRVVVPFGNKEVIGIVIQTSHSSEYEKDKIKPVIQLVDNQAVFSDELMALGNWLSRFYLYPLGDVLFCMLPSLLRRVKSKRSQEIVSAQLAPQDYLQALNIDAQRTNILARSKKQALLFNQLLNEDMLMATAKRRYSAAIVNGLINKACVQVISKAQKTNTWQKQFNLGEKNRANPEQAIAITSINQANGFTPFLIEGVTGSGKTEIYLQVIEKVLEKGKQVLILVPEIGLTPQTVARFEQRFGNVVSVWHSALTDHERLDVWKKAKYGQTGIIIGTRSAVFMPLAKPGMIIVDEEHDESFKQQDTLRYHARDVAAFRAKQYAISLVLGSATPSLESLHNALSKKYRHLQLTQRAGQATMPTQHLVDLKGLRLQAGIAPSMLERMRQQLKQGNQVLIFVNRRGYAPALICSQCGHVEQCQDCETPYTVHLTSNNLQCHRCGDIQAYKNTCSQCYSQNITTQGVGTEQIQAFLEGYFSDYSCVRIDSDSTRGKHRLNTLLTEIGQNKHQILVGTQILSKGHHFPNVTLALIVNVDSFLFSHDYRAAEKLAQLVTQFSGRAGRASKAGEVWLQSFQIGHPLLQDLVNNGYTHFSRLLLEERGTANLPPHVWQIALRVEHQEKQAILLFMEYANALLRQFKQLQVMGPFPAGVEKKQTRYRFITVTQCSSHSYINQALQQVKIELHKHNIAKKVRWALDVMPTDFS